MEGQDRLWNEYAAWTNECADNGEKCMRMKPLPWAEDVLERLRHTYGEPFNHELLIDKWVREGVERALAVYAPKTEKKEG